MEHERLHKTMCGGSQNKWRYCLSKSSPSPFLSGSHDSHSPEVSFTAFILDKNLYECGSRKKKTFKQHLRKKDRFFKVPEKILEEIQKPKPQIQQHAVQFCSKISKLMSFFGLLLWTFNYTL